jgi:amidohydrolase
LPGRLRLLGTPAEEMGSGKGKLIEAGAFDGAAAAIMCHALAAYQLKAGYTGLAGLKFIACDEFQVDFRGKSAHAAGEPWEGVNALDAAVGAYNAVSMLRQQMRPDERVHGIIESGGAYPSIIPDYARMRYFVRSPSSKRSSALIARVKKCVEAAAISTGCKVTFTE